VLPDRYQGVYVFAGDRMGVTLRFPTQWLFTPIERGTLTKSSVSRPQLLQIPSDFLAAFRQTVRLQIQDPELNLDRVAQLSGTSRQSLQRKLRKHGTTFSAEFSEIRKIEGERLLTTTARPVTEVAQALGFTNATSFTRAFKAWTGASPREYRRNQQKTHGNFTTAV
jgi:AraC-like DNA-binding protein